jgi:hypothetical protein
MIYNFRTVESSFYEGLYRSTCQLTHTTTDATTDQLSIISAYIRFLDKAAVKDGDAGPWSVCTVTQVEETKILLRMHASRLPQLHPRLRPDSAAPRPHHAAGRYDQHAAGEPLHRAHRLPDAHPGGVRPRRRSMAAPGDGLLGRRDEPAARGRGLRVQHRGPRRRGRGGAPAPERGVGVDVGVLADAAVLPAGRDGRHLLRPPA